MATSVSNSFINQYAREVKEAYQRTGSKLRNTTRKQSNVQGATTTFQTVGQGTPTTKARHGQITPMNVSHTPVTCTLADYYAGDWIDKLDESKMNSDERRVLANAGAAALGRKTDELIITQLDATSTTPVAASASGMTLAKVMSAMQVLGEADVFEEGRMWAIVGWSEWTDLMQIAQFASSDYIGKDKAAPPFLKSIESRRWLGTIWMPHSGLETLTSGNTAKSFWYHEAAVGHAASADVKTDITWHGDRASHFVNNMMSQGACLIDSAGVVEIQTDRSA